MKVNRNVKEKRKKKNVKRASSIFLNKYLTENYCEEENNLFSEKLGCFFIQIFRKIRAICEFSF